MSEPLSLPAEPDLGGWYTEAEVEAAVEAIRESMDWRAPFPGRARIEAFEADFARHVDARHAIAMNGAGTALDMAVRALDVEPGDEIVSCAINFPGTHLAVIGGGARLVLAEPDPATLNLDPGDLERRITPRTRAIVVTHMNGLAADLDAILEVAERNPHPRHGPPLVIGDAARANGAGYRGARLGAQGWLTVFSFQRKKHMSTLGEGGMVTTGSDAAAERLREFRSFGMGTGWGTNYKMTAVQAAVGRVQLRRLEEMNERRIQRALERNRLLEGRIPGALLPVGVEGCRHVYAYYTIILPEGWSAADRDEMQRRLAADFGVGAAVANRPTWMDSPRIREHVAGQRLPVAESVGSRVICPSLHPLMTEAENRRVADAVAEAFHEVGAAGAAAP
jgi:perosamine synthetase